ncbi:cysteine desulfurase NifS [Candidatus Contubernalis alkaliaceticus]|uniref:cysteine desulfurase NifS n=1 Tax=Candidatus Contubernalis alkaliaceticus TaxID=338645 RepID=UPI001F4C0B9E|nr:cysteine desulfurase NifS [Candidatus Contubernalis alkalaceticus]UNC93677.1 cysteine desulfurase NifS [Candidatus Contubernalis alkalaceticus]
MRQVYMDHSATTPVDPEVFKAIIPYYNDRYGNPSSIYSLGLQAKGAVERAREQIAYLINADPEEIYFTSGGTEADNQAIISYMMTNKDRGNHLITSAVEHHAVLDTCRFLEKQGFELTVLPVCPDGLVDPEVLKAALREDTLLVSIMHANNEVGTIQPIKELAAISRRSGAVFHTDAVQTAGKIPLNVGELGVDMLSASSHKIYGPKGIGCLYIKKGTRIENYLHGGAQEKKIRPGTENVPGIVGFGKAAELAQQNLEERREKLDSLASQLREGILDKIPRTRFTGHWVNRVPGHVSVCFEFVEGEAILLMLDSFGIMVSSGSACTSGSLDPSHVLLALGLSHEIAHGSLRLTLGKNNTKEDVDYVIEALPGIINNLREMSPLSR